MRKPAVIALVSSVLLLVYAAAGFLWLPHFARTLLQDHAESTGHQVTVAQVNFNPFTLTLDVGDFSLAEAGGPPLIAFKSLRLNAELASIWHWGVVLDEFTVQEPDIRLVVEADGSVNLVKLVPPSETPEPEPDQVPTVNVGKLSVVNGRLTLVDRSRPVPFEKQFSPVQFSLDDFSTQRDHENNYQFTGKSKAGELLEWTGRFTVQPLGSTGQFVIKELQALTVQEYLQEQMPIRLLSGSGDIAGQYQLGLDPTLSLQLDLPSIQLSGLTIAEHEGKTDSAAVAIETVGLSAVGFSLGKREVVVGGIKIAGVEVNARREADGSLNLSRLIRAQLPAEGESPEPPAVASGKPWRVAVETVELADSRAVFEDHSVRPAVRFEADAIGATARDLTAEPGRAVPVTATLTLDQQASLKADGDIQISPLAAKLAITLSGFQLSRIQPYLAQATAMELHAGELGTEGKLEYEARQGQPPQLQYSGALSINKLQTREVATGKEFIKWSSLRVSGMDYRHTPSRLLIERVDLREPYARVAITPDRKISLTQVLNPTASSEAASVQGAQPERDAQDAMTMPMRIKTISVDGGTMDFADQSIDPQFAATVLGLKGTMTGLSSDPSSRAAIKLEGSVDEYAPVSIEGKANLLAITQYCDIAMSFRNMELTTFNPYSGRYAGYNITKGKLTTELRYKLNNRQLEAEHHVILDKLEFGEATGSKQKVPLPVKLAVALLKDASGVIDIQLPVRGSLDDPSFKFGSVIWQAFMGLLTKAVTAPFAMLGSIIKGAGEELAYVDFGPGSAELTQSAAEKLGKLATGLVKRPQLKLDLPLTLAKAEDSKAMARVALNELAPSVAGEEAISVDRLRTLESAYVRATNQHLIYPDEIASASTDEVRLKIEYLDKALMAHLSPDEATLEQLAKSRAQAVQAAILKNTEIAPERIYITSRRATQTTESGDVRMELRLE